jgi:hypothetical protein
MKDERGQTTLLIIGFAIVLAMAMGVVVDSSAAYLQRQSLSTLADGAALSAADQVQGGGVYDGGLGEAVPIDPAVARATVAAYLRDLGAYADHPGLGFDVTVRDRAVLVRLSAPLDLPITVEGVTDTTVSATGSARVRVEFVVQ